MMKSSRMRCAWERRACKGLVGKPEGRRPLRKLRYRRKDIKMDLNERGYENVDWVHLAQDKDQWQALVNTVMSLRVPWNAGNFLRG
jgi:hypothetical protein